MLLNKRAELAYLVQIDAPDVICLTEILLKNSKLPVNIAEIQIKGYDCFTNINSSQVHRGITLYTKQGLSATESDINEAAKFQESVLCEIPLRGKDKVLVGGIYRSPSSTSKNDEDLNEFLSIVSSKSSHILLMGDFNHPELNWAEGSSPQDDKHKATLFMEAVRDAFLYQHVTEPTHHRGNQQANVLDLVLTNEEKMIQKLEHTAPLGNSHHSVLKFIYVCYTQDNATKSEKFQYSKGNYNKLRELLQSCNWRRSS